jgi:predicted DCC family thiol-disulfide oxidoreductase YuxK
MMLPATQELVGQDQRQKPRAIFLYDGGCGVWKYTAGFCLERDADDALRFAPLQTPLAAELCATYQLPCDLNTGILIDTAGAHQHSTAILRMLLKLAFPWNYVGMVALCVPTFIRDFCYRLFARTRGTIWKKIKQVTGMGDTQMAAYRAQVMGLEDVPSPLPPGWGFAAPDKATTEEDKDKSE